MYKLYEGDCLTNAKETDTGKRNIFLTFVLTTLKTDKCRDLSNRPAIPLVA